MDFDALPKSLRLAFDLGAASVYTGKQNPYHNTAKSALWTQGRAASEQADAALDFTPSGLAEARQVFDEAEVALGGLYAHRQDVLLENLDWLEVSQADRLLTAIGRNYHQHTALSRKGT